MDSSGNAIVVDSFNDNIWQIPLPANVGTGTLAKTDLGSLPSGLIRPEGIAIDAAGDYWVVDLSDATLWRINPADTDDIAGDYGLAGDLPTGLNQPFGIFITTREVSNFGAWTNIATLPASTYPAGNLSEGDTDTDVEGDDYTVVADGGWRDVTVSIPNTYQEIRLRPELNAGGTESGQDIALRSIRSAGTGQPQLTRPTGLSLTDVGGDITADWNDVANATAYVLEWREEGSGDAWQTANVAAPPHTFTP